MIRGMRWAARVLGVLMAGFFLVMFIGESGSLAKAWSTLRDADPANQLGFSLGGLYIVAMFFALKWERVGALLGLAGAISFFAFVATRPQVQVKLMLAPLFIVCVLPPVLYLVCWVEARKVPGTRPAAQKGGSA